MTDFKPGLEGVVAFETEIAEPDRDGGALRYRGVDIEELVGSVPFEKVWGLLVDEAPEPGLPPAEEYVARDLTGRTPSDLQSVTARLGGEWGLGQLIDISDDEAKEDLRRLSATMISVCAQSARLADGHADRVDPAVVAAGRDDGRAVPARVARRGRSEGRPGRRHVLDLHRRARPQRLDLHGAHRRLDGSRLRCGALVGGRRALRPAPRRRARRACCRCSTRAAAAPSVEGFVKDLLDRGDRLMGFGHRVYRAEDPRARLLRRTAQELGSPRFEVAEELERVALAELHARKPDRVLATNVEFWSAVVLDVADVPPQLAPAMFACSRTAGWSAHILEQKRLGRLVRPSARYVGPAARSLSAV